MEQFLPHIHCYLGNSRLIWTMVVTDSLIALAYLSISINLYDLVRKIRLPLSTMFVAFGSFILACGTTHALEVYNLWIPNYWLSAAVKVVTAGASVATAIWIIPVKRQAIDLIADVRASQSELSARVAIRTKELEKAVQSRDQFLSVASHELKTPITSLKLQVELMLKKLSSNKTNFDQDGVARLQKGLTMSQHQIDRLIILVEDLLDVGRIQEGRLSFHRENVDLSRVIQITLEQFSEAAAQAACPIELDLDHNIQGFWDYSRIEQVLANLISNAIKYAAGSKIEIRTRSNGHEAEITIRDYGQGIPIERQGRIFERFERATASRSISGLGLGLFIVKQLVMAHEGRVDLESFEGEGTCFKVHLPLQPTAAATSLFLG